MPTNEATNNITVPNGGASVSAANDPYSWSSMPATGSSATVTVGSPGGGYANVSVNNGTSYPYYTAGAGLWSSPLGTTATGQLNLSGEKADVIINGDSLLQRIENLEKLLPVLLRKPELEEQSDELRTLSEQYDKLVQKLNDQNEMIRILSQDPDGMDND